MSSDIAVVLVDPLNEFLHPDGKLYSRVQSSLEANRTVDRIKLVVQQARNAKIPIFYALHQQTREDSMAGWKHLNSSLLSIKKNKIFEEGSWGAKVLDGIEPKTSNGDTVVSRHWNSSSFANTDLDYQLRQRDITHLVLAGMAANTCLESTARYARELGYHVTLLTDATAGFTIEATNAATNLIWPIIADKVTTVDQWRADINPQGKI